jgi:hypothetical protein
LWRTREGFDASLRGYQKPDFQSNQYLSKIKDKVKRLILDNSLDNSRGSRLEVQAPGLLEPFLTQIWMSVKGWGWILGVGAAFLGLGSGIGGGGGGGG